MTSKFRDCEMFTASVPYKGVIVEPKDLYDIYRVIDAAPELEARLLASVGESAEVNETLLDAMATIYALRSEVAELEDRLENAAYADDTIW